MEPWFVDLKNGNGGVTKSFTENHDVTMTLKDGDFVDLFTGQS